MVDIKTLAAGTKSVVGESPVWDPQTNNLHWVDIIGRMIFTYHLGSGRLWVTRTEDFPTAIGMCRSPGKAVVAFAGGVSIWEIGSGKFERLAGLDDDPEGNRLNEGTVGPDGNFWVGTMQTNLNPDGSMRGMDRNSGAIYVVRPDGSSQRITGHKYGISNTLAWDEARGRMVFGDTLARTHYSVDWPIENPKEVNPEKWSVIRDWGYPDGSCLDADGYLWNARYAGGCLLRIAPDGSLDWRLELPATNVTACTFGGPDHATLYVTTATNELDEERLSDPNEGALLAMDVGIAGCPTYFFDI